MASCLTQWVSDSHAGHQCPSNRFLCSFQGCLSVSLCTSWPTPGGRSGDPQLLARKKKWVLRGTEEAGGRSGRQPGPLYPISCPPRLPLFTHHHVQITFSRAATRSPSPSFWWSMECSTSSWSWSWRPRGGEGLRERQAPGHRYLECGAQALGNTPSTPNASHGVSAPTSTAPHCSSPGERRSCL